MPSLEKMVLCISSIEAFKTKTSSQANWVQSLEYHSNTAFEFVHIRHPTQFHFKCV